MKRRWSALFELFKELNWSLLGTLVVVSAIVAWAGDILGMKLGKKRISFMKLRPKYTSRIISVVTGVGIAIVTLSAVSVTSESVRTALFSMRYVQNQITSLTAELQTNRDALQGMERDLFYSRAELQEQQMNLHAVEKELAAGAASLTETKGQLANMIEARQKEEEEQKVLVADNAALRSESEKLSSDIAVLDREAAYLRENMQRLREGRIAVFTGEILAQGVIYDVSMTPRVIDTVVSSLSEESRARVAYRFGISPDQIQPPNVDAQSVEIVKKKLANHHGRYLLRLTAGENTVEGEIIEAELNYYESNLVFPENSFLTERRFQPGVSREELEDQVYRMLREVNAFASSKGVLKEPITGNVGTIDSAEFLDAIEQIGNSSKGVTLQILTGHDIYTEGPVKVKFVIK